MDGTVERELREKIRNLELQNKLLRSAADLSNASALTLEQQGLTLDDFELIDVHHLDEPSDDDSWLYSSPKTLTPEQKAISPYGWLRNEMTNGIKGRSDVDTRTFTRPARRGSHEWRLPVVEAATFDDRRSYDDVVHVQAVARQQQESLRQMSPLSSPKLSSGGSSPSVEDPGSFSPEPANRENPGERFGPARYPAKGGEKAHNPTRVPRNGPTCARPSRISGGDRSSRPNVQQVLRARGALSSRSLSPAAQVRASPSPDRSSPKTVQGHSRIPVPKSSRSLTPSRGGSALRGCNGDDSWKEGCF